MVMLDFIGMCSSELFGRERERKIPNEKICVKRNSNKRHATPRQVNQRFRQLSPAVEISSGVFKERGGGQNFSTSFWM